MDMPTQKYTVTIRKAIYYNVEVEAKCKADAENTAFRRWNDCGEGKEVDIEISIDQIYSEEELNKIMGRV